ncbi:hypothetical protein WA158_004217 [Blastocystis sp. Blastoise]
MNQQQVQDTLNEDFHIKVNSLFMERLSPEIQIKMSIYGGSFINDFYMLPNSVAILYYEENYLNRWIRRSLEMNSIHTMSLYNITFTPCPSDNIYLDCETWLHNRNVYINIPILHSYILDAK